MEKKILDYAAIKNDINTLIQFFPNTIKLDKSLTLWKEHKDLRHILFGFTKLAGIYYEGIVHLTGDPKHNEKIKPEYQVCVGPQLRVLMDILMNLVFIKDDLQTNVRRYIGTGIKDKKKEISFFESCEGDWKVSIERGRKEIEEWMRKGNFSDLQLDSLKRFPNTSLMRRADQTPGLTEDARGFIVFLHDWYYPWLSQMGHVSMLGMAHMQHHLLELEEGGVRRDEAIEGSQSYLIFLALSLLLAIFSETFQVISVGDKQKLINLWIILCDFSPDVKRIYEKRYRTILT